LYQSLQNTSFNTVLKHFGLRNKKIEIISNYIIWTGPKSRRYVDEQVSMIPCMFHMFFNGFILFIVCLNPPLTLFIVYVFILLINTHSFFTISHSNWYSLICPTLQIYTSYLFGSGIRMDFGLLTRVTFSHFVILYSHLFQMVSERDDKSFPPSIFLNHIFNVRCLIFCCNKCHVNVKVLWILDHMIKCVDSCQFILCLFKFCHFNLCHFNNLFDWNYKIV